MKCPSHPLELLDGWNLRVAFALSTAWDVLLIVDLYFHSLPLRLLATTESSGQKQVAASVTPEYESCRELRPHKISFLVQK
jgi:hypothetical protein